MHRQCARAVVDQQSIGSIERPDEEVGIAVGTLVMFGDDGEMVERARRRRRQPGCRRTVVGPAGRFEQRVVDELVQQVMPEGELVLSRQRTVRLGDDEPTGDEPVDRLGSAAQGGDALRPEEVADDRSPLGSRELVACQRIEPGLQDAGQRVRNG